MKNIVADLKSLESLTPVSELEGKEKSPFSVPILGETEILQWDFSFLQPLQFTVSKEESQTEQESVSILRRTSLTNLDDHVFLEKSKYENSAFLKQKILTPFIPLSGQSLTDNLHVLYLSSLNEISSAPIISLSSTNINYPLITSENYSLQIQVSQIVENTFEPDREEFDFPRLFFYYIVNKKGNLYFSYFRSDFPSDISRVFLNPLELNQVWLTGIHQQWLFDLVYISPRGSVIGYWRTLDGRYLRIDPNNKSVSLSVSATENSLFYMPGWQISKMMDITHRALHKKGKFSTPDKFVRYDNTNYFTNFFESGKDYFTLFTLLSTTPVQPYVHTHLSFPINRKKYQAWHYYVETDPQATLSRYEENYRALIQQMPEEVHTFSDFLKIEIKETLPLSSLQIENQVWASPIPDLSPIIFTVQQELTGSIRTQTLFLSGSPTQTWPLSTFLQTKSFPPLTSKWMEFQLKNDLDTNEFTTHYLRFFPKYTVQSVTAENFFPANTTLTLILPNQKQYEQYFENKQKSITHVVHKLQPLVSDQTKERKKNDIKVLSFHQIGELQSNVTIHVTFDIKNWKQIPISNLLTNIEKEPSDGTKPGGFALQNSEKNKSALCCFIDTIKNQAKIRFLEKFQLLKQFSLPLDITIVQQYIDETKIWITGPKKTDPTQWKIYSIKFDGSLFVEETITDVIDITNITKYQHHIYFHFVLSDTPIKTKQIKIHSLTKVRSEGPLFNGKVWVIYNDEGTEFQFNTSIFFVQGQNKWENIGKNLYKNGKFFYYTGRVRALSVDPFGYLWYLDEFGKLVKIRTDNSQKDPLLQNVVTTNFSVQQSHLCQPTKEQSLPFAKIQFIYHSELKTYIGILLTQQPYQIIQFDLQTGKPIYTTIYQSTDIYNTVEPFNEQQETQSSLRWVFLVGPKQGNTTAMTDYFYVKSRPFPLLSTGVHCFTVVTRNDQIRLFIDGWLFDIITLPEDKICYGMTSRQLLIGTENIGILPLHQIFQLPEQKLADSDGCLEAEVWCGSFADWEVLARAKLSLYYYQNRPFSYPVTVRIPMPNQVQKFVQKDITHLYFHHLPGQKLQKIRTTLSDSFYSLPEVREDIEKQIGKTLPAGYSQEIVLHNPT